jgi:hypothetical protein
MLTIQYLILLLILQLSDLFVLLDTPSKSNLVKYNGDKSSSSSVRSIKSYYTLFNTSSSSLIDYMRTLYEQEKQNDKQVDFNLIRAVAPRIGKISL